MAQTTNETKVVNEFWPKLAKNLARLPYAEEIVAGYYCAFDKATPLKVKGTLLAALAYFIMPLDVIPDFLLGLGFTDDLAVLMTAFTLVKGHINAGHRDKAKDALDRIKAEPN
jgi:uncharacterized membrane protein YkvA (DUF1232 family)